MRIWGDFWVSFGWYLGRIIFMLVYNLEFGASFVCFRAINYVTGVFGRIFETVRLRILNLVTAFWALRLGILVLVCAALFSASGSYL